MRVTLAAAFAVMGAFGACTCGPTEPQLPEERIDSGFTVEEDAFRFPNFGGVQRDSRINEELLIRLHGKDAVCASDQANCRLRPIAKEYMKAVNTALKGGRCEGFALLAGLIHQGDVDATTFGDPLVANLQLDDNEALGREIAYWFSTQYLRDVVLESTRPLGAEEAVRFLAGELSKDNPEMFRLGIARVDEQGRLTGGHAVVPIAVGPGEGEGQYVIWVYDNNIPGEERQVLVDVERGEWSYAASTNPEETSALYVGNAENGNLLYLAEMTPRIGRHSCSFCDDENGEAAMQHVFGSAGVEVSSSNSAGEATGEIDGRVVTGIPGSKAVPILSAELWTDDTGVQSYIPVDGRLSLSIRPSGTGEQAGDQEVTLFSQRAMVSLSAFSTEDDDEVKLTIDLEESTITYESPGSGSSGDLAFGAASSDDTETLVVVSLPDEGSTDAEVHIDEETGNPTLKVNSDDEGDSVVVTITSSDESGEKTFTGEVPVPDSGSTTLLFNDWTGEGDELGAEVDTDGDGSSDLSVSVSDAGQDAVAPGAPTDLVLVVNQVDAVTLGWTDNAVTEAIYELYRDEGAGFLLHATLGPNVTSFVDTGLAPATLYRYRVRAVNLHGASRNSNTAQYLRPGCDPGTSLVDGACVPCSAGSFCPGGTSPEARCPAGTTDSDSDPATSCDACPAGTIDDDGDPTTACVACVAGQYCAGGDAAPVSCAASEFDDDGDPATVCSACTCQNGTCNGGASGDGTCLSCDVNYFGANCDTPCPGDGDCSGNGTCDGGPAGTGVCACDAGYGGDDCSLVVEGSSCMDVLERGNTVDGMYVIDPDFTGPAPAVEVYCDLTTDGGGWTLLAYADGAALGSQLTFATPGYDPSVRTGAEHLDARELLRNGGDLAYAWTLPGGGHPTGNLSTYSDAASYPLKPADEDLDAPPDTTARACGDAAYWRAVDVTCLIGACPLPFGMRAPVHSQDACSGSAYGLVNVGGDPTCDWPIDATANTALYMNFDGNDACRGVVPLPGGASTHFFPDTLSMWHRAPRGVTIDWTVAWGDVNDDLPVDGGRYLDVAPVAWTYENQGVVVAATTAADLDVAGTSYNLSTEGGVLFQVDRFGIGGASELRSSVGNGRMVPHRVLGHPYNFYNYVVGTGLGGQALIGGASIGGMNDSCSGFVAAVIPGITVDVFWGLTFEPTNAANCNVATSLDMVDLGATLYVGGWFSGSLTVGLETLTATGGADGFLVELDAYTGEVLSLHHVLSGTADERVEGIAVLPDGNIAIVGVASGTGVVTLGAPGVGVDHALGGSNDGFYLVVQPSGGLVGGGVINTPSDERLVEVRASRTSADYFVGGLYDGSTTIGGTAISGASYGLVLARISQQGAVAWVDATLEGDSPLGLRRFVVDGADQIRFAHNQSASGLPFAGVPVSAGAGPRLYSVDGVTGRGRHITPIASTMGTWLNGFVIDASATAGVAIGYHDGPGMFGGLPVPHVGSNDQFLARVVLSEPGHVVIPNASFEYPDLGGDGIGAVGDVGGTWNCFAGSCGVLDPAPADNVIPVDGDQVLYMEEGAEILWLSEYSFSQSSHRYRLTGVVYERAGVAPIPLEVSFLGGAYPLPPALPGAGQPFEIVLELPLGSGSGDIGVTIRSLPSPGVQTLVDGLRLVVEPIPMSEMR